MATRNDGKRSYGSADIKGTKCLYYSKLKSNNSFNKLSIKQKKYLYRSLKNSAT
ncbi:unnamed protein product [Meloidogyne enterolobii]|uniref:Uncharacterized protein n=1 Tax=Meloidogyne enterolobii TaxID=390850 RepID=A0ACB0Z623_MELEN